MVILKKGADNAAAKDFFDYMLSDRAKNIMRRYGYGF
jgi:accessory colonization factor AcfC